MIHEVQLRVTFQLHLGWRRQDLENYEMANDVSEKDYFNDMIITQTIANFKLKLQIDDLEYINDIKKFKVHIL